MAYQFPLNHFRNDEKQATMAIVLLAIMSVVVVALIVMAVLSTRACSV